MNKNVAAVCFGVLLAAAWVLAQEAPAGAPAKPKRAPREGVKEPGVQRPISNITPDAVITIEGVPDWIGIAENAVWISNKPRSTVSRVDVKTSKLAETIPVGQKPCAGLAIGFGSVWVPNCGDMTVSRVDMKRNKVTATIPAGPAHTEGSIAAGFNSVWILSDPKGKLARIDPKSNKIETTIDVPAGSFAAAAGEGAVWVTSSEGSVLSRIDPKTSQVTDKIPVGPMPRFLTIGDGSIWTLNQGDGTVTRVDAKTRKVISTIALGVPGGGGEIAYGDGAIWVTVFEIPLTRIDVKTNKVTAQWMGPGGDAVRFGHGSVWLSNLRQQNIWRIDPKKL